jgi:hypothetical protein
MAMSTPLDTRISRSPATRRFTLWRGPPVNGSVGLELFDTDVPNTDTPGPGSHRVVLVTATVELVEELEDDVDDAEEVVDVGDVVVVVVEELVVEELVVEELELVGALELVDEVDPPGDDVVVLDAVVQVAAAVRAVEGTVVVVVEVVVAVMLTKATVFGPAAIFIAYCARELPTSLETDVTALPSPLPSLTISVHAPSAGPNWLMVQLLTGSKSSKFASSPLPRESEVPNDEPQLIA